MKSDGGDLARLLDAENIACAADLEIAHGDFHAAAIAGRFDEGVRVVCGRVRGARGGAERGSRHRQGGSIFRLVRAADRDRRGQSVGSVDEDGVGIGDVDAVFDDGRGDEDVGLSAFKGVEDGVEFIGRHLSVAGDDAGFGKQVFELFGDAEDRFDAVVDEEGLAIAGEFAQKGVFDDVRGLVRR